MPKQATSITLSKSERERLMRILRQPKAEARQVLRARIILLAADGIASIDIARKVEVSRAVVSKWRTRFYQEGMNGLRDDFRPGRPVKLDEEKFRLALLDRLEEAPPQGFARWDGRLLAKVLEVSPHHVWRTLKALGISLKRRRSWCISTDPQFTQKAADVVGLYLSQPENAVVLCFDEKPCIQALERAQGWLKCLTGARLPGLPMNTNATELPPFSPLLRWPLAG